MSENPQFIYSSGSSNNNNNNPNPQYSRESVTTHHTADSIFTCQMLSKIILAIIVFILVVLIITMIASKAMPTIYVIRPPIEIVPGSNSSRNNDDDDLNDEFYNTKPLPNTPNHNSMDISDDDDDGNDVDEDNDEYDYDDDNEDDDDDDDDEDENNVNVDENGKKNIYDYVTSTDNRPAGNANISNKLKKRYIDLHSKQQQQQHYQHHHHHNHHHNNARERHISQARPLKLPFPLDGGSGNVSIAADGSVADNSQLMFSPLAVTTTTTMADTVMPPQLPSTLRPNNLLKSTNNVDVSGTVADGSSNDNDNNAAVLKSSKSKRTFASAVWSKLIGNGKRNKKKDARNMLKSSIVVLKDSKAIDQQIGNDEKNIITDAIITNNIGANNDGNIVMRIDGADGDGDDATKNQLSSSSLSLSSHKINHPHSKLLKIIHSDPHISNFVINGSLKQQAFTATKPMTTKAATNVGNNASIVEPIYEDIDIDVADNNMCDKFPISNIETENAYQNTIQRKRDEKAAKLVDSKKSVTTTSLLSFTAATTPPPPYKHCNADQKNAYDVPNAINITDAIADVTSATTTTSSSSSNTVAAVAAITSVADNAFSSVVAASNVTAAIANNPITGSNRGNTNDDLYKDVYSPQRVSYNSDSTFDTDNDDDDDDDDVGDDDNNDDDNNIDAKKLKMRI